MDKDDLALVSQLTEIEEGLTPWEMNFVESLAKQAEIGRPMSARQRELAEGIVERLG
jgi:hypothetical protein